MGEFVVEFNKKATHTCSVFSNFIFRSLLSSRVDALGWSLGRPHAPAPIPPALGG